MLSSMVGPGDVASRAERSVMPARSQSQQKNQSARSKPPKTKTRYPIKLETVYPRVLLLVACILYLSTAITSVNIGLINLANFIYPRYDRALDEFRAQSTTLYAEQILYGRLDKLLSSQLGRGFIETHENCLVRGLEKANYELLGLGFQYPNIRMQVMDWTTESCGRLQHTPQIVIQDPTPQQAVLTCWAGLSYRSRRTLEKALGFMRQQASWIWTRCLSAVPTANASALTRHALASVDTSKIRYDQRPLPEVPFGFTLRCEPSQPCRLFYPPTSALPDKVSISPKALVKLERQSQELHAFYTNIHRVLSAMWHVELSLKYLSMLFAAFALIASIQPALRTTRAPGKWNTEEKDVITAVGNLFVLAQMSLVFMRYPGFLPYDELVLSLGLFMLLYGVSMLLQFFVVPSSESENVVHVYGLIKELYLIARGREIPEEENIDPKTFIEVSPQAEDPETKAMEDPSTDKETNSSSSDHCQRPQSPKPHHRLASPTTSLQEYIETYTKALREEHNTQQTVESGVDSDIDSDMDTESDTEPDSENSGFVDLAGGITPQLTDAESGWSMVDA